MEWIDNAESYICPVCDKEVNNPNRYGCRCPRCGFVADSDREQARRKHEKPTDASLKVVQYAGSILHRLVLGDYEKVTMPDPLDGGKRKVYAAFCLDDAASALKIEIADMLVSLRIRQETRVGSYQYSVDKNCALGGVITWTTKQKKSYIGIIADNANIMSPETCSFLLDIRESILLGCKESDIWKAIWADALVNK